jgi:hypothetical protein
LSIAQTFGGVDIIYKYMPQVRFELHRDFGLLDWLRHCHIQLDWHFMKIVVISCFEIRVADVKVIKEFQSGDSLVLYFVTVQALSIVMFIGEPRMMSIFSAHHPISS